MKPLDYRPYYERNLPHVQPAGATLFVTYRLVDSLPAAITQELRAESEQWTRKMLSMADAEPRDAIAREAQRALFARLDRALDATRWGSRWLAQPEVATIVADALHHLNGQSYDLLAFCVMPNHVHAVFTPLLGSDDRPLSVSRILHSLKGYTAHQANQYLHRQGSFWQHESYDHWVRSPEECQRVVSYVYTNPIRAGLVEHWRDWQWTYTRDLP